MKRVAVGVLFPNPDGMFHIRRPRGPVAPVPADQAERATAATVPPALGARDEPPPVEDPLRQLIEASRTQGDEQRGVGRWTRLSG